VGYELWAGALEGELDIVQDDAPSGAIICIIFQNIQFLVHAPSTLNSFYTPTHCTGQRLHFLIPLQPLSFSLSIFPSFLFLPYYPSTYQLFLLCCACFMEKGWGLTLDTSSSQSLSLFPSKQPSTSFSKLTNDTMFPLLGFPVNLSLPAAKEDEHNRKVVGEVDFFSDRITKPTSPPSHDQHVKPNIVKKEIVETPLHVNVINLPKLLISFFFFYFFPRLFIIFGF